MAEEGSFESFTGIPPRRNFAEPPEPMEAVDAALRSAVEASRTPDAATVDHMRRQVAAAVAPPAVASAVSGLAESMRNRW